MMRNINRAAILIFLVCLISSETTRAEKPDSLGVHQIVWVSNGEILPWFKPEATGAGYDHIIKLASEFIKDGVPVDPETGLKLYYLFCEFQGPEYNKDFYKGTTGRRTIPHNPACVFAGFTESLAVKYRIYSGDDSYLEIVRNCLDHMLTHGTTPSGWTWENCSYASSFPGNPEYSGTGYWEPGRGDGEFVLEPDKVGEMGVAYLQFYEITEDTTYLKAALNCANALAKNVRIGNYNQSPWPFRVHARTGVIIEEYCSNVLPAVEMFDELARIQVQAGLDTKTVEKYWEARELAWKWLFSQHGPMKTYVWKGYYEDVPLDNSNENRVQITPLEVARYLIEHPEYDPYYKQDVPALINWCKGVFGTDGSDGYNAQCEQLKCFRPMGSHSARYASVCAMWYELSKTEWYKTEAFENFNWATYCTCKSGVVSVGPGWTGAWFSDGYGDYIKHFVDGIAAIPEWSPTCEDHMLKSTSIVQKINYGSNAISYRTFLPESTEVLRLKSRPQKVTVDGKGLKQVNELTTDDGWEWEKLSDGGVIRIKHSKGKLINIDK